MNQEQKRLIEDTISTLCVWINRTIEAPTSEKLGALPEVIKATAELINVTREATAATAAKNKVNCQSCEREIPQIGKPAKFCVYCGTKLTI
ncbi:hypothetical protein [Bacillus sp. PK3_68]|uniref:hypothetical protein n=1 Tax=Bacillus sp. PK3_68 TaxID=2027408 RepID=UPI000E7575C6|nr:hypothetical protein [Bacillus sp. PK3_68]RJS60151.1 hypothetical protein CJ483_08805 [Bacillus sp. PK3_68]